MYIESVDMNLSDIITRQNESCSLEQVFYTDPDIFQLDMEHIVDHQWILVDHVSRIPNRGNYFLYEVGGESIIIIRGDEGRIYAHYNVCCHRGSRICLQNEGKTNLMVCPYHSWSYRQDGTLANAPYMPKDFDPSNVSLKSCHVRVCEGIIFICLAETPPDFKENIAGIDKYFQLHSTGSCKVAYRHTWRTAANWKLCVENFGECYHCLAAHPELCAVRTEEMVVGMGAGPSSGDLVSEGLAEAFVAFQEKAGSLGQLPEEVDDIQGEQWFRYGHRSYLKEGCLSESQDGQPIAPLLKGFRDWDAGYTGLLVNPLSGMTATNDACYIFKFAPISAQVTDAEIVWLVNEDAEEGRDYDLDRLKWAWEITGGQDKTIIENNQKGVNSRAYTPHHHSIMENNVAAFCQWYLANLKKTVV
jgi:glycine betaine catabolism A